MRTDASSEVPEKTERIYKVSDRCLLCSVLRRRWARLQTLTTCRGQEARWQIAYVNIWTTAAWPLRLVLSVRGVAGVTGGTTVTFLCVLAGGGQTAATADGERLFGSLCSGAWRSHSTGTCIYNGTKRGDTPRASGDTRGLSDFIDTPHTGRLVLGLFQAWLPRSNCVLGSTDRPREQE